ncbi:sporulation protein YqfC [Clostridium botulinum]|uniref:sporulation protein YqfC n=1 Tax=Clostridium botulinum TaxID=1491 RepID=UPI001A91D351|nr:sporulation protein YqfC [Clostridium botulinum]MBO0524346.1 sporulation protein YqfC [Clostridium botulinum]MBO0529388.1 sporulation protein YqfC [Clostridium botulinum]MBO0531616.1 sporulation protein YqfC [Clostridium botulinum]MBO0536172.1 sporulation protein YqfC [Clostridium botulinum]MBO0540248.1 sporulation protein YqfC [Clostridium botulinum]
MSKKFYNAREAVAEKLDLPRDIILNQPKIIVTGNEEITIENHRGVVVFEEKVVKINSGSGLISIYGKDFEILFMGGSTITLGGKFKSIEYEGSETNEI